MPLDVPNPVPCSVPGIASPGSSRLSPGNPGSPGSPGNPMPPRLAPPNGGGIGVKLPPIGNRLGRMEPPRDENIEEAPPSPVSVPPSEFSPSSPLPNSLPYSVPMPPRLFEPRDAVEVPSVNSLENPIKSQKRTSTTQSARSQPTIQQPVLEFLVHSGRMRNSNLEPGTTKTSSTCQSEHTFPMPGWQCQHRCQSTGVLLGPIDTLKIVN